MERDQPRRDPAAPVPVAGAVAGGKGGRAELTPGTGARESVHTPAPSQPLCAWKTPFLDPWDGRDAESSSFPQRDRARGELRARPGVPSPIATLPRCHVLPGPGDGVPRIPGCGTSPKPGAAAQISIATWRGALCPAPPPLPPQGHLNATMAPASPWHRSRGMGFAGCGAAPGMPRLPPRSARSARARSEPSERFCSSIAPHKLFSTQKSPFFPPASERRGSSKGQALPRALEPGRARRHLRIPGKKGTTEGKSGQPDTNPAPRGTGAAFQRVPVLG